jgi:hypothetical protein
MNNMTRAESILEKNKDVLIEFFVGFASCEYYNGTSYQLYLDLHDDTMFIHQEASDQSWLQRDDGSIIQIDRVSGYCDIPEDEQYQDGDDINDFGYDAFIKNVASLIADALLAWTEDDWELI